MLIRTCFPSVDATTIAYLGSGWQFDAFLTSDGWAFRFPRWDWCSTVFEPEARVHRFIATVLPSQIRLPLVELLGPPTPPFAYPFAGHRYIPGVGAEEVGEELMPPLAREIANFLGALHSTPAPVVGAAGIHELVMDDGHQAWLEHGTTVALTLRGRDPILDAALSWLSATPTPPHFGGPLHLVHGDLAPEHLIVNPATGFLNGIIEWTETHLGDAARDFVFLVTWRGWPFAEDVLRLYTRAVDREFRARVRHLAQLLSLMWLAFAHEQGHDLEKHIRAVHNAFAPNDHDAG